MSKCSVAPEHVPDKLNDKEIELSKVDPANNAEIPCASDDTEKPVNPDDVCNKVNFSDLFRYADSNDKLMLFFGSVGAVGAGVLLPSFSLVFGALLDAINESTDFMSEVRRLSLIFVYFGIGMFIGAGLEIFCFMYSAERQSKRVRELYLTSLLRQEVAWHDQQDLGAVATQLTADTRKLHDGLGDKLGQVVQHSSGFFGALGIALYQGWELTLVILACAPILGLVAALMGNAMAEGASGEHKFYGKAGAVANEAIAAMRTVASNQMERPLIHKYSVLLRDAYERTKKKSWGQAMGMGSFMLVIFSLYGFGLWYGSTLIRDGRETWPGGSVYTGGTVLSVFYALITGVMMLGNAAPHFGAVAAAQAAAYPLFELIERQSRIDPLSAYGLQVSALAATGRVELRNVTFRYPTRPDAPIFSDFSLAIEAGTTNAFVGPSGCGKSTIMQLLERFYDPDEGGVYMQLCLRRLPAPAGTTQSSAALSSAVPALDSQYTVNDGVKSESLDDFDAAQWEAVPLVDGAPPAGCVLEMVNIKHVQVASLRRCFGLVAQEPVLFAGTVADNLRYSASEASAADLDRATKMANAYDFIQKLQHGYDTSVGEGGRLLSGGQKQRIAIARAMLMSPSPPVLMLDEATSALDNKSERVVQEALDRLLTQPGARRTSIVIAHRLTTIRNADRIVVFDQGRVREEGSHDQLMAAGGYYAEHVHAQDLTQGGDAEAATDAENPDAVAKDAGSGDVCYEHDAPGKREVSHLPAPAQAASAAAGHSDAASADRPSALRQLLYLTKEQKLPLIIGTICGMADGCSFPLYAMLMARMTSSFYEDTATMMDTTRMYAVWYFLLGVAAAVTMAARMGLLSKAGEALVKSVRYATFVSILSQEMGWHDIERNSAGQLVTRLAADATYIRTIIAERYGVIVSVFANVLCSFIICFTRPGGLYMTLLMLFVVFPLLSAAGVAQFKVISGFGSKSKTAIEKAGQLATEGVGSLRTVAAFNGEKQLIRRFQDELAVGLSVGHRSSLVAGIGFGGAQFLTFASYALSFWFGGLMVSRGTMSFESMLQIFLTVEMASMMLGQLFQLAPDFDKAQAALDEIFTIMKRRSLRSPLDEASGTRPAALLSSLGAIEVHDVHFHYPTRPSVPVLRGVSFVCQPNTVTAVVSESGGGKSTLFALLQRYYDPIQLGATDGYRSNVPGDALALPMPVEGADSKGGEPAPVEKDPAQSGRILAGGHDITELNLGFYRSLIGVVGQEPVLFSGSIADNIRGGNADVTQEDVEEAAKLANVHELIMTQFPDKYDTLVGAKGAQLSGGQKQRVAIARALARGPPKDSASFSRRRPQLLLLDEATSALDSTSESLVQEALNKAMKHTTTIVIAHRLATIRNADQIVVLHEGRVAEQGTHQQLMAARGHYAKLVAAAGSSGSLEAIKGDQE